MTALYVVLVPRTGGVLWAAAGSTGNLRLHQPGGALPAVPGGARYPDPDRRRMDAAALLAAVCVPDYAGWIITAPGWTVCSLSFAEFFATAVLSTIFMFVFETPTFAQIQGRRYLLLTAAFCPAVWPTRCKLWARKNLTPPLPAWPCAWKACSAPGRLADFGPDPFRRRTGRVWL